MTDGTRTGSAKSAPHLRSLISRLHPGKSVRQISQEAGDPGKLSYYIKPTTVLDQMPKLTAMKEIARVLGCPLEPVVQAFAADIGVPWGMTDEDRRAWRQLMDPDAEKAVAILGRLSADDRRSWLRMGQALAGGPRP